MTALHASTPIKISEPGIYGLPEKIHHGDCCAGPSLSSSGAIKIMKSCPARFWFDSYLNPDRPPDEPSTEMDFGKALHVIVLEPEAVDERLVVIDADSYRKAEVQRIRDETRAAGLTPILKAKFDEARAMVEALAMVDGVSLLADCRTERSIVWRDEHTGVWLKGRPDAFEADYRYLIDYKTVASAHPIAFGRHLADMGYFQQAAWYLDGFKAVTGAMPEAFYFIAQERDPPYVAAIYQLDGSAIEWGRRLNRRAISTFARCIATGKWPAYQDGVTPIGLPSYAEYQLEARRAAGELETPPSRRELELARAFQAPLEDGHGF